MRKIIFSITLFLFVFNVYAQSCRDIKDIKHKDCHIAKQFHECAKCDFPHSEPPRHESWGDENVVEFTTTGKNEFLRFYSSNKKGSWLVKASDICIDGKMASYKAIKEILVLTEIPNAFVVVDVPAGVFMLEGRICGSPCDECRQFCVEEGVIEDWFVDNTDESIDCSF